MDEEAVHDHHVDNRHFLRWLATIPPQQRRNNSTTVPQRQRNDTTTPVHGSGRVDGG